jgi:hypothetical protein
MALNFLRGLEASRWEVWAVAVLGLGCMALAFIGGRRIFLRTTPPPPSPAGEPPPLDPFLYGSASEQRQSARRKGRLIEVLISDEHAKALPWKGYVIDRSLGGLCLCCEKAVEAGSVLTVRVVNAPPMTPWLEVEVKSCRQDGCDWVVGCQFLRPPPTALRLLFG